MLEISGCIFFMRAFYVGTMLHANEKYDQHHKPKKGEKEKQTNKHTKKINIHKLYSKHSYSLNFNWVSSRLVKKLQNVYF